ncbi:RNA-binding transcriptional accessory protein [Apibacter muscae]|uniref:RNA-binding transcriptional accessory protein n=1 Tax=Apibacter muscae TaxID=2509004 RepID=A0A563DGR8_9FLAO|nr:Tex family protein [Apibacter muscae]TWP29024.1 RNA-binding transcriptional accessory protein [Apibacter muscae]TWP30395.1 RNA-binding transcriptional accessory protein [Apibacter muscae]
MNKISFIQKKTELPTKGIENTLRLLDEEATIPFISRYRKEMTGNLDEVQIQKIAKLKTEFEDIQKRKESILKNIDEQGALKQELNDKIVNCYDLTLLEDYYLPYKKKRKTRASVAKEQGLEPLAKILMKQNPITDLEILANKYINKELNDVEKVLQGARDIMAEWMNENEIIRAQLRKLYKQTAIIESAIVKNKENEEEAKKYLNYFEFSEPLKRSPSHRILAMMRGENEGFLRVKIKVDKEQAIEIIERNILKTNQKEISKQINLAIKDSFSRLLEPALSNEILQEAKVQADKVSIQVFSANLQQLLLQPPLGEKRILAIDPGYKSGCKIVCLSEQGELLHNDTVYPHAPQKEIKESIKKIKSLINAYKIEAISIGNGTASRETERLIQSIAFDRPLKVFVVNEAGASVYSASKLAREEFPNYDVTVRGAVSIGRRLSDPLAELVKIDPKSIGVGQYQHDVDQTLLKNELDIVVMSCVNNVGVNLNTASKSLLSYVSGIGEKLAENIIKYRTEKGLFTQREELKKIPRLGDKAFQQSSAFLRIPNAKNPLDNSAVHPESYPIVEQMAKDLGLKVENLVCNSEEIKKIKLDSYITSEVGLPTLKDIIKELEKPGLDPRKKSQIFTFDSTLKTIEDLKIGMKVPGIINNITNFGCFVDIGIKESGLVHISKVAKEFVTDINTVVHLNQTVEVKIIEVDIDRKRIQLSMID